MSLREGTDKETGERELKENLWDNNHYYKHCVFTYFEFHTSIS